MLRKLATHLKVLVIGGEVVVTWKGKKYAKIAYQHQYGISGKGTAEAAEAAEKKSGGSRYKDPATYQQAKALKAEGYRHPAQKKRGKGVALKRVSIKWIRENITFGRAGLILKCMRNAPPPRRSWVINVPARPFLGVPQEQVPEFLTEIAQGVLKELRSVR
ncbi:MAG: hypothetical protein ACNI27_11125 [Desulfovibrio sp.]